MAKVVKHMRIDRVYCACSERERVSRSDVESRQ